MCDIKVKKKLVEGRTIRHSVCANQYPSRLVNTFGFLRGNGVCKNKMQSGSDFDYMTFSQRARQPL